MLACSGSSPNSATTNSCRASQWERRTLLGTYLLDKTTVGAYLKREVKLGASGDEYLDENAADDLEEIRNLVCREHRKFSEWALGWGKAHPGKSSLNQIDQLNTRGDGNFRGRCSRCGKYGIMARVHKQMFTRQGQPLCRPDLWEQNLKEGPQDDQANSEGKGKGKGKGRNGGGKGKGKGKGKGQKGKGKGGGYTSNGYGAGSGNGGAAASSNTSNSNAQTPAQQQA